MSQKRMKKIGQSTVEYVVLVAGVLAVIVFFTVGNQSPFRQAFNRTLLSATNGMEDMANRLRDSRPSEKKSGGGGVPPPLR